MMQKYHISHEYITLSGLDFMHETFWSRRNTVHFIEKEEEQEEEKEEEQEQDQEQDKEEEEQEQEKDEEEEK